jgi:hypothetical protein
LNALTRAVVAFADQQHVALGRVVDDKVGRDNFIRRKDHAADDSLLWDRGSQPAAGIQKCEVIVPPGKAVLGKHDCRVVAQQRRQAGCKTAQPGSLQHAEDKILRAKRGRIVGRSNVRRKLGHPDTQRQALRLHRLKMRPAHDAGHITPGQRKPHRKMAADRARAEDADTHWGEVPVRGKGEPLVSPACLAGATGNASTEVGRIA